MLGDDDLTSSCMHCISIRIVIANNGIVGSSALAQGAAPEELIFAASPELLVGRLLCSRLQNDEVVLISGAEPFAETCGGRLNLSFMAHFYKRPKVSRGWVSCLFGRQPTKKEEQLPTYVACIPFINRHESQEQEFSQQAVTRELRKISGALADTNTPKEVATGPWGSADPTLNALIQWAAISQAGRQMHFYPSDADTQHRTAHLLQELKNRRVTVGELVHFLSNDLVAGQEVYNQVCDHFSIKHLPRKVK